MDVKESTRRAVKFRRGSEIIIVTHEGRAGSIPLSDAKGDVFALVATSRSCRFPRRLRARRRPRRFRDVMLVEPDWADADARITSRRAWDSPSSGRRTTPIPWPGSADLAISSLGSAPFLPFDHPQPQWGRPALREGPCGSMWAAHTDDAGIVVWLGGARSGMAGIFDRRFEDLFRLGGRCQLPPAVSPKRRSTP
jgi:hypothetical protein